jgi:hypothetical protein
MQQPRLFFIDIDGTLIGDVAPHLCEYELVDTLDKRVLHKCKASLADEMRNGLLRPGLSQFVNYVRSQHQPSEFFIYTASSKEWAHVIVPMIEKISGIKFNRPLFTRDQCSSSDGSAQKSIEKIAPIVNRVLKKKYGMMMSYADILNNSRFIDDNKVLSHLESKCLVLCPTYGYRNCFDVLRLVSLSSVNEHFDTICKILQKYKFFSSHVGPLTSADQFRSLYYLYLGKLFGSRDAESSVKADTFWVNLRNHHHLKANKQIHKNAHS